MKGLHFFALLFFLVFLSYCSYAAEPTGGVVKDLIFFQESLNDSLRFHAWSSTGPTVNSTVVHSGTKSIKFVTSTTNAGVQVYWGGNTSGDWWGADTSVFWAHSNSHLQFWINSSTSRNVIDVYCDGYQVSYGLVGSATISSSNTWQLIDFVMPSSLLDLPLKGFQISFGNATPTIYIDGFIVTNVRMYAGSGTPVASNFNYIAASQIGYAPGMKKQFSSPVNFSSFTLVRTSDDAVVFTGGASVRTVTSGDIGNTSVYIGDFTSFTTPGRYKIVAGGKESLPFTIGPNVFDGPLRAAERFFYYQRAFTDVSSPYAEGPWVHPTDIAKAPSGIVKGWHDAGDLTIYMPTMTQTIFWLLESWMDFTPVSDAWNIPESGNGIPDILDEARWGLEWVKSQQDANGGFWGTSCAGGTNQYSYGSTTPNNVGNYAKTVSPTTQNTAKAIAVLAYASKVYQSYDAAFATSCLNAALAGWAWMSANPNSTNDGDVGSCGSYAQGSDATLLKSHKMWAAASMLYATGNSTYETAFQSYYLAVTWISSFSRSEAFAGKTYLRCTTGANATTQNTIRQSMLQMADGVRSDANAHPFQWGTHYYWGALSNGAHRAGEFSWGAYMLDTTRTADRDQLLDNVHYMFGRNYMNMAYMSGADAFGVTQWRREGFHHWMKALNATPWHFPGAVAGGPNSAPSSNDLSYPTATPYPIYGYFGDPRYPRGSSTVTDGRFTDNDSWSTNEIAINWQGAILYNLLAAQRVANGGTSGGGTTDSIPPVISNVQAGNILANSATITWTTDEVSTSVVEYGTTLSYGSTANASGFVSSHSVTLTGLSGNTLYYFRVRSADPSGNSSVSAGYSFSTGLSKSYVPTSTTILVGALGSGSLSNLVVNDGSSYVVSSTSTGGRVTDWYGETIISESPASVGRLTITYDGKYSNNNTTQKLYLYNWSTSAWTQIDSRTVGNSDVFITNAQSTPTNYISSSGQIRLRVAGTWTGNPNRSCSGDLMIFTIETVGSNPSIKAVVKVFLEGAYNTTASLMNTTLKSGGYLAAHFGSATIPATAVDSINIELRNASSAAASTTRKFRPAWVMKDGTIRDFFDTTAAYVSFDTAAGNYYLVIRHRNHLGIMTAAVVSLNESVPASPYDFTLAQNSGFGTTPMKALTDGRFALLAGDANQSNIITAADANFIIAQLNATGYNVCDVNLSGIVTAADANIAISNLNRTSQVP